MDQNIIREAHAWNAMSAFLVRQPACMNEHLARLTAAGAIQALDTAGFQIVPKPIQGLNIVLDTDGARAVMEAAASAGSSDLRIVSMSEQPNPETDPDEEPEAEKDNWGVRACLADDMAARHGCRVELSGRDDPADPNTYYNDNATYAVVTERTTGRLVGLVECWDTEDGDPIVPRTWLKAVLLAWRANATPKRAA